MILLKPYRELEHTADFRLEIRAWSWPGLLRHAIRALSDTLTDPNGIRELESRPIECRADRRDELLVSLLKKVHLLFETDTFLVKHLVIGTCSPLHLKGELWGEDYEASRHPLKREIKAITYHALEVKHGLWGWRARVVFDI